MYLCMYVCTDISIVCVCVCVCVCVYGRGCVVEKQCNQTAHSVAVFMASCVVLGLFQSHPHDIGMNNANVS